MAPIKKKSPKKVKKTIKKQNKKTNLKSKKINAVSSKLKVTTNGYVDLKYKPKKDDLIAQYYVEPRTSLYDASNHLAAESSIGTWTELSTLSKELAKKLRPTVFHIDEKKKIIKIAYHSNLFEKANMPQILSAIAGNVYGMKAVKKLKLLDIDFPKSLIESFQGPAFGIEGIKKLTKITNRPLLGTIVKPKVGLTEKQHAKVAYDAWLGGLDVVKDDENLTSMEFNDFYKRIDLTLKALKKAQKETGEVKIYLPNVTAETTEMLKRADFVIKNGGTHVMIDILTAGFSGLQTLRKHVDGKVAIHAHRAMHAALTRSKEHGISMLVIAKIARIIGVDQIHIGTAGVGKMNKEEDTYLKEELSEKIVPELGFRLKQNYYNIKSCLSVASGGLHPGSIPKLTRILGMDIVAQFGGGCHGHPDGTYAGAKAIRQATEAVLQHKTLPEYAKTHPELKKAIDLWGITN